MKRKVPMFKFYASSHNFYRQGEKGLSYLADDEIHTIEVVRNEEFGFFLALDFPKEACLNIYKERELPWWGLSNRYRLSLSNDSNEDIQLHLLDYVIDDDGLEKADIICQERSKTYPAGQTPVFVSGKIGSNFQGEQVKLSFSLYQSSGYDKEKLLFQKTFIIQVLDYCLEEDHFYLDLWQHPSSWARTYRLANYSDEHFIVIENYLREMKKLGQKVINLIVSDFPWAGQMCFDVKENPSRLYEYNMIGVRRRKGRVILDFSVIDRYIDLCFRLGIKEEINLFGLLGNWHWSDFGSPLEDYRDPIRIMVYDEDEDLYDFIRNKEELKDYIGQLIRHLKEKGYLGITKIIGDEPNRVEYFNEYTDFIKEASSEEIDIKYAIHRPSFYQNYRGKVDSFSINTLLLPDYYREGKVRGRLAEESSKMTWFACCIPDTFNTFIKSPLIESRYTGLYTYLWNFKGMLRWAYALYPENVYQDITYKPDKWPAGDMFLVYPGANGQVVHSLREKNMLYGIQDYNLFKQLEKKDPEIFKKLVDGLGVKKVIEKKDGDIVLDEYPKIQNYTACRKQLIKEQIKG